MRLLYVDVASVAVNPTANLTPLLAALASSECFCFGPGFSSHAELAQGFQAFIDRHGPFDVIFYGPNIPLLSDDPAAAADLTAQYLRKFTVLSSPLPVVQAFLHDVIRCIDSLDAPLSVVSALNFDFYAATPKQMDMIARRKMYLMGPNQQFISRVQDLPDYAREEKHYARKIHRISDAYFDFIASNPERVIAATHFVAETEFAFSHLDDRRPQISIPGVDYVLRERAIKKLKRERIKVARKSIFYAYKILGKLGLPVLNHYLSLKIYQNGFVQELMTSKAVYTARGGFGLPIRKFFEIPAAGALLICASPYGFRDLGFRNGENFIECDPDSLPEAVSNIHAQPEKHAEIAKAGQKLVFERHSLRARAAQLRQCIDAIIAGKYVGSRWVEGEFRLS